MFSIIIVVIIISYMTVGLFSGRSACVDFSGLVVTVLFSFALKGNISVAAPHFQFRANQ